MPNLSPSWPPSSSSVFVSSSPPIRRRMNRVLGAFPQVLFSPGTLRREFFLPRHFSEGQLPGQRRLAAFPGKPYIKMINVVDTTTLLGRLPAGWKPTSCPPFDSKEMGLSEALGNVYYDVYEQKSTQNTAKKITVSLGIAMIGYVHEGSHCHDTSFFILYHIESSPAPVAFVEIGDPKQRFFAGQELGRWFVYGILDIVSNGKNADGTVVADPFVKIITEDKDRIANEYVRYLLKKDAIHSMSDSDPQESIKALRKLKQKVPDSPPSGSKKRFHEPKKGKEHDDFSFSSKHRPVSLASVVERKKKIKKEPLHTSNLFAAASSVQVPPMSSPFTGLFQQKPQQNPLDNVSSWITSAYTSFAQPMGSPYSLNYFVPYSVNPQQSLVNPAVQTQLPLQSSIPSSSSYPPTPSFYLPPLKSFQSLPSLAASSSSSSSSLPLSTSIPLRQYPSANTIPNFIVTSPIQTASPQKSPSLSFPSPLSLSNALPSVDSALTSSPLISKDNNPSSTRPKYMSSDTLFIGS